MPHEEYSIYPSPPEVHRSHKVIKVLYNNEIIAHTSEPLVVLERNHPPAYYIPIRDVRAEFLVPSEMRTQCPFKGDASYWSIKVGDKLTSNAAWAYKKPKSGYEILENYVSFYRDRVDE